MTQGKKEEDLILMEKAAKAAKYETRRYEVRGHTELHRRYERGVWVFFDPLFFLQDAIGIALRTKMVIDTAFSPREIGKEMVRTYICQPNNTIASWNELKRDDEDSALRRAIVCCAAKLADAL